MASTIRYNVYANHLGPDSNADLYAERLAAALRAAYPNLDVNVCVCRNVEGVGSGLQGEPEGVDVEYVRAIAERTGAYA